MGLKYREVRLTSNLDLERLEMCNTIDELTCYDYGLLIAAAYKRHHQAFALIGVENAVFLKKYKKFKLVPPVHSDFLEKKVLKKGFRISDVKCFKSIEELRSFLIL